MRLELYADKPDTDQDADELAQIVSEFYCSGVPSNIGQAVKELLCFHRSGEELRDTGGTGTSKRLYQFDQDADAIFASFLSAYGINLSQTDLHWWQFQHLLFELPDTTPMGVRLKYRAIDPAKVPRSERKHFNQMRALYALKSTGTPKTLEDRNAAMLARVQRMKEEQGNAE